MNTHLPTVQMLREYLHTAIHKCCAGKEWKTFICNSPRHIWRMLASVTVQIKRGKKKKKKIWWGDWGWIWKQESGWWWAPSLSKTDFTNTSLGFYKCSTHLFPALPLKSHDETSWKGIYLYKYEGKHALWSAHTANHCEINDLLHGCVPFLPETVLTSDVHILLFDQ